MRLILELIVRDILQQLLAGIGVSRCTAYDGPFGGFGVISGKRTGLNPVGERTHRVDVAIGSTIAFTSLRHLLHLQAVHLPKLEVQPSASGFV